MRAHSPRSPSTTAAAARSSSRRFDRYLADRGAVLATAKALVIHPNTLRQRLQRIEELTGLSLAREDLLSLEVALKLYLLR